MITPASQEHCLKAVALVYNRLGEPSPQSDEDFDLLVDDESRDGVVDLLMTVAGIAALVLEEIIPLGDSLDIDDLLDVDKITQARTVLDSIRDVLLSQGINEPTP